MTAPYYTLLMLLLCLIKTYKVRKNLLSA